MNSIKKELAEYLDRDDLLHACLLPGKIDEPSLVVDAFVSEVMDWSARLWKKVSKVRKDPIHVMEKMNRFVFEELGFEGKSGKVLKVIDNSEQYYFHKFLVTKKGSPILFAILLLVLCEQVGIESEIVSFPSHFFLKIKDIAGHFYVDPYDNGKIMTQTEFQRKFKASMQRNRLLSTSLFETVPDVQLVAKQIQQLKHVFVLKNDALKALRAIEMLTIFYPSSAELTRDRGILYCEMEYFSQAMVDLKSYLKQCPNADDVKDIKKLTSMLRGYRETMN